MTKKNKLPTLTEAKLTEYFNLGYLKASQDIKQKLLTTIEEMKEEEIKDVFGYFLFFILGIFIGVGMMILTKGCGIK